MRTEVDTKVDKLDILYENNTKKLVLYTDIREETVKLFDEILWGTGENQYKHKDSRKRLEILDNPNFVELHYKGEFAGICLFINRMVSSGSNQYNYFTIRYLFGVPKFRHTGIVGRYAAKTMQLMEERQVDPTIFVGIVEHRNKRSFKLVSSLGYTSFCTLKTVGFSRFFPRKNPRVRQVTDIEERQLVLDKLKNFYADYSFVHFNSIFKEPYYVYEENGKIVAGVQAQKAHWVVKNLGKGLMKTLIKSIHYIPFVRRVFNPKRFEFIGLDGIFCEPGKEEALFKLCSHLLKINKVYSAMFWADEKSELFKNLSKTGKLGLLNKFTTEGDSYMMVKTKNIPEKEITELKNKPTYHSAFDFL
nr:hypothetical protein [Saprospiraceae bacterium]